jgi:hypothetical protein
MSETDILQVGEPLPRIGTVDAGKQYFVFVSWAGSAQPDTRSIDLAPAIFTYKIYRSLRDNSDLFRTVHVINSGDAIAWGANDEVDMSATMLEHLASETMVHADFRAFMERNKLTLDAAAAQLGIGRRLAAYYASGEKPIPRYIALACAYLDSKNASLRDEGGDPPLSAKKLAEVELVQLYKASLTTLRRWIEVSRDDPVGGNAVPDVRLTSGDFQKAYSLKRYFEAIRQTDEELTSRSGEASPGKR